MNPDLVLATRILEGREDDPRPSSLDDCATIHELEAELRDFEGCALKRTATNTVFADGSPESPVMLIGEAPGADDDRTGRPFSGSAGLLLDGMLSIAGLSRDENVRLTHAVFGGRPATAPRPPTRSPPEMDEAPATSIAACRALLDLPAEGPRTTDGAPASSEDRREQAAKLIAEAFAEITRRPQPEPPLLDAPPAEPVATMTEAVPEPPAPPAVANGAAAPMVARKPIPFARKYGRRLNAHY